MIMHQLNVLRSVAASLVEGGRGMMGTPNPNQPELPIRLYEFEASPFCRRVREVLTMLNLDVEIYPCPKGGTRFRPDVKELAGKTQFPFLIDENTNHKSHLIHHENISLFPYWTEVPRMKDFWFTLVFSGLPKECKSFSLKEEIPEEGGFFVQNIKRNGTDVYRVKIS